jgi:CheY-like chemotaxis protein
MANSPSQNPCGRILLVDDNCLGLAARRSVLVELGHQVLTSCTASEALELCAKQNFDVVVTDYKMPKMNGIELIGRLRKLHPAISVILISGFTDTLGLDEATTGADIVLQKSNNEVPQLIRAVNRLLRKQQAPPKKSAASQAASKIEKRKAR